MGELPQSDSLTLERHIFSEHLLNLRSPFPSESYGLELFMRHISGVSNLSGFAARKKKYPIPDAP